MRPRNESKKRRALRKELCTTVSRPVVETTYNGQQSPKEKALNLDGTLRDKPAWKFEKRDNEEKDHV
jgi:hypothetical protein